MGYVVLCWVPVIAIGFGHFGTVSVSSLAASRCPHVFKLVEGGGYTLRFMFFVDTTALVVASPKLVVHADVCVSLPSFKATCVCAWVGIVRCE